MKYLASCFVFIAVFTCGFAVAHAESQNAPQPSFLHMIANRLLGRPTLPKTDDASTTSEMHGNFDGDKGNRPNASTTLQDGGQHMGDKIKNMIEQERGEIHQMRENRFTGMINHFDVTIAQLQDILARLQSRITKIKATGTDTTTADGLVTDATTDIGQAQASLLSLATLASSTPPLTHDTASTTAGIKQSTLSQMLKLSDETTKHIKDAQQALIKATISLMKGNAETHASTTPRTNTH